MTCCCIERPPRTRGSKTRPGCSRGPRPQINRKSLMLPLALLTAALAAGADASRLAVIRQAPDFTLTDQDGRTVRSADLRGKIIVASFVFTTCNGTCPATTHRMSALAQALKEQGLFKDDAVRLLSITLDPARDTPEALRRYMRLYD